MDDKAHNSIESDFPKELASPARRALAAAGYTKLTQLAQVREEHLLSLHGIGPNAIRQLRQALAEKGLSLL